MQREKAKECFEAFQSGIVKIYQTDTSDRPMDTPKLRARFQDRVIGNQRYYLARAAGVQISRLIRVPFTAAVTPEDDAVIDGCLYDIKRVQPVFDTKPPCIDLTLQYTGPAERGKNDY